MNEAKKDGIAGRLSGAAFLLAITILLFWAGNYFLLRSCLDSISVKNGDCFKSVNLTFSMYHPLPVKIFDFKLNGKDISEKVFYEDRFITINLSDLSQGYHYLEINLLHKLNPVTLIPVSSLTGFEVDTLDPEIELEFPKNRLVQNKNLYVIGKTEPSIKFSIEANGRTYPGQSDSAGNFYKEVFLDKEVNHIAINAIDRTGNKNKLAKELILDENPPEIILESIGDNPVIRRNHVDLKAKITDSGSGVADCYFEVDGRIIPGSWDEEEETLTARLTNLDEGGYSIKVAAKDNAGWKAEESWNFVVHYREEPGDYNIRPGAIGKIAELIQKKLVKIGYLNEADLTGVFDEKTKEAVLQVQKDRGCPETGIVDRETLLALSEKIYVYLDEFVLKLVSADDELVKQYPIAPGSYYYPTPTGNYTVIEKVYYPAWYPPNSPWARGKKPVPPGPGNPLGTRWIGLDADVLGIHGTPSSWSIGTASSHGCIRMYISDVEELFEYVNIGTPVTIYQRMPREHKKFVPVPQVDKAEEENV